MPTEAAQRTLEVLRDGSQFSWHVIPLFVIVVYIYSSEIAQKNFSGIFAGLAFLGADLFNETWNSLVFHFTERAPAWGVHGSSAFVLLIGLNLEIALMFSIAGIVATKALPPDPSLRIAGLPNRWFFAVFWSIISVIVEIWLNSIGVLSWEHAWWNAGNPWLIFLVGYLPFYAAAYWVYDMPERSKQVRAVAGILGFDVVLMTLAGRLGWL